MIYVTPAPTNGADASEATIVPDSTEEANNPFGYTLPPTASPTPTVPPLELTVEDDANLIKKGIHLPC